MRKASRPVALVAGLVLGLGLLAAGCGTSLRLAGSLQVSRCIVNGQHARCGTLIVPENWLTGKGRTIAVSFVVIPAYGRHRAPDPVVDFSGGPGGSAISDIPAVEPELVGLNETRDLVFIDQRGTGASNPLNCRPWPAGQAQLRKDIRSCLASLRSRADVRYYTSAMMARDVAHVLTALHYQTVNLFGASYGATAAQVFAQLFPARVRTMTLVSGTLLSIPLFERFPLATQRALDAVFARCAKDPVCHTAFPHLAAEWATLLTTPDVNRRGLATGAHALLMSAATAAYLPLAIHSIFQARNSQTAMTAIVRRMTKGGLLGPAAAPSQSIIEYPIGCAEPWARQRTGQITDHASFYYPASVQDARWWRYVCSLVPHSAAAAAYGQQHRSQQPVLMINGTADPQDPPANMAGAARIWPDSLEVAEPGQGHSIELSAWLQCDGAIVQAFVQRASARGLSTTCQASVPLPTFPAQW